MSIQPHDFAGASIIIPGVYTDQKFPPSPGAGGINANIVCLVGQSTAGIPYNATSTEFTDAEKINLITSPDQAKDILQGGAGYYGCEFFLLPTEDPNLNLPAQVYFIRVDPATRSTGTVSASADSDSSVPGYGDTQIDLTANVWGTPGNQIARKIEAGTNVGHKVTIREKGVSIVVEDDISFTYMQIQYTGAGSACVMTINATQLTAVATGAASDNLTLTFADYPKLSQLVNYINDQTNYTCTMLSGADSVTTTFDEVVAQDIKTAAYDCMADVEALIQFFNLRSLDRISAEFHSGSERRDVENDSNYVFLSGGTTGSASNSDWSGALDLAESFNINMIIPLTGDQTICTMFASHASEMSSISNKKNRQTAFGAASGLTKAQKQTAARAYAGNARVEYCATPFKRADRLDPGSEDPTWAPFYGACVVAGIRYGNNTTTAADLQSVKFSAVTETYTLAEKKQMIEAGCTIFGPDETNTGEIVCISNTTTYQGSENRILNRPSMLRTADYVTLDSSSKLRVRMRALKRAPTAMEINEMQNFAITNMLPGYIDEGVLDSFSNVEFSVEEDAWYLDFKGTIPAPLLFILQTQRFSVTDTI